MTTSSLQQQTKNTDELSTTTSETKMIKRAEEPAPMISDLTEPMNDPDGEKINTAEAMEEEEDGLASIMLNSIPTTIPMITPNYQCKKTSTIIPQNDDTD
jgi:hypothetical protein